MKTVYIAHADSVWAVFDTKEDADKFISLAHVEDAPVVDLFEAPYFGNRDLIIPLTRGGMTYSEPYTPKVTCGESK